MGVALPECNYGAHSCKSHTGAAQMVWHNWCFSGEKASVIPLCIMSEECVLADSAPHHWNLDRKYAGFHPFINPEHNCNNKEQDWYDNFVSQNSRSLCQGWPSCLLGQCQITPTLCTCSPTPPHIEKLVQAQRRCDHTFSWNTLLGQAGHFKTPLKHNTSSFQASRKTITVQSLLERCSGRREGSWVVRVEETRHHLYTLHSSQQVDKAGVLFSGREYTVPD